MTKLTFCSLCLLFILPPSLSLPSDPMLPLRQTFAPSLPVESRARGTLLCSLLLSQFSFFPLLLHLLHFTASSWPPHHPHPLLPIFLPLLSVVSSIVSEEGGCDITEDDDALTNQKHTQECGAASFPGKAL